MRLRRKALRKRRWRTGSTQRFPPRAVIAVAEVVIDACWEPSTRSRRVVPGRTLYYARRRTHATTQPQVPDIRECVNLGRVKYISGVSAGREHSCRTKVENTDTTSFATRHTSNPGRIVIWLLAGFPVPGTLPETALPETSPRALVSPTAESKLPWGQASLIWSKRPDSFDADSY
jgi:hypothetical protein